MVVHNKLKFDEFVKPMTVVTSFLSVASLMLDVFYVSILGDIVHRCGVTEFTGIHDFIRYSLGLVSVINLVTTLHLIMKYMKDAEYNKWCVDNQLGVVVAMLIGIVSPNNIDITMTHMYHLRVFSAPVSSCENKKLDIRLSLLPALLIKDIPQFVYGLYILGVWGSVVSYASVLVVVKDVLVISFKVARLFNPDIASDTISAVKRHSRNISGGISNRIKKLSRGSDVEDNPVNVEMAE
jgi:hypothetical protein